MSRHRRANHRQQPVTIPHNVKRRFATFTVAVVVLWLLLPFTVTGLADNHLPIWVLPLPALPIGLVTYLFLTDTYRSSVRSLASR